MIQWSGYDWLTQERWGQIHTDKNFVWYDDTAVIVDDQGFLHLKTHYNPKYFSDLNVTSNIGVGLISCTSPFKFGTYEIEAKLPEGKNLWPAFWMWSFDSWPPEIDVFEAYSNNRGSYFSLNYNFETKLSIWDVDSNVWWNKKGKNSMLGGKSGWFGIKNPSKNFIKYKLVWSPDGLKFFYDNKLIRQVDDVEIMAQINNTTMNVILNNSLSKPDNDTNSDFVVKYFKFSPL